MRTCFTHIHSCHLLSMTTLLATDDAPVVTCHALYVADTVNIFLALWLPFVFAAQKCLLCIKVLWQLRISWVFTVVFFFVSYWLLFYKKIKSQWNSHNLSVMLQSFSKESAPDCTLRPLTTFCFCRLTVQLTFAGIYNRQQPFFPAWINHGSPYRQVLAAQIHCKLQDKHQLWLVF